MSPLVICSTLSAVSVLFASGSSLLTTRWSIGLRGLANARFQAKEARPCRRERIRRRGRGSRGQAGRVVHDAEGLERARRGSKEPRGGSRCVRHRQARAPESFPRFARHGHSVLIAWDDQDSTSDPYLHAAVLLGHGLVTRKKTQGAEGDINALPKEEV